MTLAALLLVSAQAAAQQADILSAAFRDAAAANVSKVTGSAGTSLAEMLGAERLAQWHEIAGTGRDNALESDLQSHLDMLALMRLSPSVLNVYNAAFATPYRTDVSFLKYFGYESAKLQHAWSEANSSIKAHSGSELRFESLEENFTSIDSGTGSHIGVIMRDEDGYSLFCVRNNRLLLNLYPFASAHYGANGLEWVTDPQGRSIFAGFTLSAKQASEKEDKEMLTAVTYMKATHNVKGQSVPETTKGITGMHLIPPTLGGGSTFINIVPVKSSAEGIMDIQKQDSWADECLRKGVKVTRTVKVEYPDDTTLKPSRISFTYISEGVDTKTITIDNQ